MANTEWLEIFRSWDLPKLQAHEAKLEEQISVFSSQGVGSKNYTKDLGELRGQLSALVRVKGEKSGKAAPRVIVTDFSGRYR